MTTRRVERATVLPGTPSAAWDAVMSPEIAPIIDPAVRESRPDREPIDVGTRFTIQAKLGMLPIRGTSEVTRWEPTRIATFVSVKGSGPMSVTATDTFEPADDDGNGNGTRYCWSMEFSGPWPRSRAESLSSIARSAFGASAPPSGMRNPNRFADSSLRRGSGGG